MEGLYPGDYLKETGTALAARDGDKWLGGGEDDWLAPLRDFAIESMMALIRDDLPRSACARRCSPRSGRWSSRASSTSRWRGSNPGA